MKIIDADGHIVEKSSDVRSYLPEPHNRRAGSLLPSNGLDTSMGGRLGGLEDNDLPTRLRDMDREGIDVSVLFPTSSFALPLIIERDFAVAYARAYNDFISDFCKQSPRIKGIGVVPFQDVEAAVNEVNRAVTKLGLVAIAVASQGLKEHLGSKSFWPIYEELQRLNVPLCVHNRHTPPGENIYDRQIFKHAVGRPIVTAIQFAGLMYAGIPEKFPK